MMEYFKRTSVNRQTKKIVSYLLMTAIGIVLITPLLWMVFTSLKPMEEIVCYPPTFFQKKLFGKTIWIQLLLSPSGVMQGILY